MKKLLSIALVMVLGFSLAACGGSPAVSESTPQPTEAPAPAPTEAPAPAEPEEPSEPEEPGEPEEPAGTEEGEEPAEGVTLSGTQAVVMTGFDWGPGITKAIISLDQPLDPASVSAEAFAVTETKESFNWAAMFGGEEGVDPTVHITAEAPRTVTAAYVSDADGNAVEEASSFLTLELFCDPNNGSPYCYDVLSWHNTVCNPYELALSLTEDSALATAEGEAVSALEVEPAIDLSQAIMPQLKGVDLSGTFTGSDGRTLCYAAYAPEDDGEKHPLVIWLHGAGEGGEDPTIVLLGNKVSALVGEEFQEVMGGAYVLTPQTIDFWLVYNDEGDWQGNPGTSSVYNATLKELIDSFVEENPGIDANRIYIGGCSNGGYMTMDMIMTYPDYFAAAYPICEAYSDEGITDEQLEGIKDLPVWFIWAEDDTTVTPENFEIPTVERLRELEANVHTSVFPNVVDTSGLYTQEDGSPYQYMGHWSWLYFFNNEREEDGVNMWQWMAQQHK